MTAGIYRNLDDINPEERALNRGLFFGESPFTTMKMQITTITTITITTFINPLLVSPLWLLLLLPFSLNCYFAPKPVPASLLLA